MFKLSGKTLAIVAAIIVAGGGFAVGTVTNVSTAIEIVMNPSGDTAIKACTDLLKGGNTDAPPAP